MGLFFTMYIAYIAFFIYCMRGADLENTIFSIIRDRLHSKGLSGKWVRDLIWDIFGKFLAIGILGLYLIPMTKDIPYLINDDVIHISGVAQEVHKRKVQGKSPLYQTLVINDSEINVYFVGRRGLEEGVSYTIDYLPHSKFAIDIIKYN